MFLPVTPTKYITFSADVASLESNRNESEPSCYGCMLQTNCNLVNNSLTTNIEIVGNSHVRNFRSLLEKDVSSNSKLTASFDPNALMYIWVDKGLFNVKPSRERT